MAHGKVRALHPDFFSDDDLAEVSIPARLLFAGLWCFACDNGHLRDRSKQIKRWIYATDDVNAAELLRELETEGMIERADGWITIPNLPRRQKVDGRYFKTCDHCEVDPERSSREQERRAYGLHVRWHVNKAVTKDGCVHCERETRSGDQYETRSSTTINPVVDGDGDGDGDGYKQPCASADAADATDDRFAEFWDAYDHKKDRKRAEQKWKTALKKRGVTADLLIDRASAYVASQKAAGKHPRYTKHADAWLNGECWNDETPAPDGAIGLDWATPSPIPACPPDLIDDPRGYANWLADWNAGKPVPTADGTTARKAS